MDREMPENARYPGICKLRRNAKTKGVMQHSFTLRKVNRRLTEFGQG